MRRHLYRAEPKPQDFIKIRCDKTSDESLFKVGKIYTGQWARLTDGKGYERTGPGYARYDENVQTTLNVYSHVLPGWQTEFMKELDKAYMNYAGTNPSDAEDPDDLEDMKGLDDPEDPGDMDGSDFYVI